MTNEAERPKQQREFFTDLDPASLSSLLHGSGMLSEARRPKMIIDVLLDRIERAAYINGSSVSAVTEARVLLDAATSTEATLRLQLSKQEEARGAQDAEIGILKQRVAELVREKDEALPKLAELHASTAVLMKACATRPPTVALREALLRAGAALEASFEHCQEVPF